MTDEPCAVCGRPPSDGHDPHHLTGKETTRRYLDKHLTASLCHDHHELLHEDLRDEGLDKPVGLTNALTRVGYRLERVGVFLARAADGVPLMGWLGLLANAVRRWADELYRFEAALDAWDPSWRLAIGLT